MFLADVAPMPPAYHGAVEFFSAYFAGPVVVALDLLPSAECNHFYPSYKKEINEMPEPSSRRKCGDPAQVLPSFSFVSFFLARSILLAFTYIGIFVHHFLQIPAFYSAPCP